MRPVFLFSPFFPLFTPGYPCAQSGRSKGILRLRGHALGGIFYSRVDILFLVASYRCYRRGWFGKGILVFPRCGLFRGGYRRIFFFLVTLFLVRFSYSRCALGFVSPFLVVVFLVGLCGSLWCVLGFFLGSWFWNRTLFERIVFFWRGSGCLGSAILPFLNFFRIAPTYS